MERVFFSGIGGIGMSALARYLHSSGIEVSGSDQVDSPLLAELEADGVQIFRTQKPENVPEDCTEFIYTEALPENHSEWMEAKKRNIPAKSYFEKLGEISRQFFTICVAGTHGKSGTTVMTGLALEAHHVRPNVIVGTKVFEWNSRNFRKDSSNIFVVESCEYRESFLHLHPDIVILTNVEPEHLDYYKTPERYFEGFRKFVARLSKEGIVIADVENQEIQRILKNYSGKIVDSRRFLNIVPELRLKGEHFRENASKVLALFDALELDSQVAKNSLQAYRGAWRRFEYKGEKNGVIVLDDYGHHPTELLATLRTLRETYPDRKKWVIFQPHQYSRTAEFLEEFGKCFTDADEILIPSIYRVRDSEEDMQRVSPEKLVEEIAKNISSSQRVRFTDGFENTVGLLKRETKKGDVVLTIGAGPVNEVGEEFLGEKSSH